MLLIVPSLSRANLTLDTRCVKERCIYCDMRCDVCLEPTLDRFDLKKFPSLGEVQCCSELCSRFLFTGSKECAIIDENVEWQKGQMVEMQGCFTVDDLQYPGLKTVVQFMVCQTAENFGGNSIGTKYIMLWHRSLPRSTCIEYAIDSDFNAVKVLDFEGSQVFSDGEVTEMMKQLHEMLVKIGIPYRFTKLKQNC